MMRYQVNFCRLISGLMIASMGWIVQAEPTEYRLRLAYVVPYDRAERDWIPEVMGEVALKAKAFYQRQMELYGFGSRTFQIEEDPLRRGFPWVHIIKETRPSFVTSSYLNGDIIKFSRIKDSLSNAGFQNSTGFRPGAAWFLVADTHTFFSSGKVTGVGQGGWGDQHGGESFTQPYCIGLIRNNGAMIFDARDLLKDTVAEGELLGPYSPPPGPYPMVYGLSTENWGPSTMGCILTLLPDRAGIESR